MLKSSLLPLKIHMFDWSFSIFEVWYLQTPVVAYPLACWTILHLWIIYFQKGDKIVCQILRLWDWPCSSKGCPHFVSCSKQMENWDCFFPAKLWGPREISKEKQHKSRVWESRCKMIESRWQRAPAKRIEIETNQVLRIARADLQNKLNQREPNTKRGRRIEAYWNFHKIHLGDQDGNRARSLHAWS